MMIPESQFFNKLKNINEDIAEADEASMVSVLGEFFDELQSQKKIESIDKYFANQEAEDIASLKEQEQDLLQELGSQQKKIELYCKRQSISLPQGYMCPEGVNEFRAYEHGRIISSGDLTDSLIQAIVNELSFLANSNLAHNLKFVRKFAFADDSGNIKELKIVLVIIKWRIEKQRFDRIKTGKLLYKWKRLKYFYDLYGNFETRRVEALEKGDLFYEGQLCEDFKKIKEVVKGKQISFMKELKHDLKQVCYFVLENFITSNSHPMSNEINSNQESQITATIKPDMITLSAKDRINDISFERYDQKNNECIRAHVLLLLLKKQSDGVSRNELTKIFSATKIITARRGINDRLQEEWHVNDYISKLKAGRLKINKDYPTKISNQ